MMISSIELTPALFWDIDPSSFDWHKDADFLIIRVLMRGTFDDWVAIKLIYGMIKIKKAVLAARYLDKKTLAFCSVIFESPKDQFKCYTYRQLNRELWDY